MNADDSHAKRICCTRLGKMQHILRPSNLHDHQDANADHHQPSDWAIVSLCNSCMQDLEAYSVKEIHCAGCKVCLDNMSDVGDVDASCCYVSAHHHTAMPALHLNV